MKRFSYSLILFYFLFSSGVFADNQYKLGAGDKINVIVYGEDSLSLKDVAIGEEGGIVFPFIGEIQVLGITSTQLEKMITRGLKGDYLVNPNVHVYVVEYRPFYIQGEINSPGGYPYQPGLTVSRAISLGGGFTERASKNKIFLSHPKSPKIKIKVKGHEKINPGDVITIEESFF